MIAGLMAVLWVNEPIRYSYRLALMATVYVYLALEDGFPLRSRRERASDWPTWRILLLAVAGLFFLGAVVSALGHFP